MQLIINPGSGPVANSCFDEACKNMEVLKSDIAERITSHPVKFAAPGKSSFDGRYQFFLNVGDLAFEIGMPGIPIDRVRYLASTQESCWNFPRLYVNGSSWLWRYAIDVIVGHWTDAMEGIEA